jgi:endonuclease/exonuclease/phosphatase family metal-dependent hydrolase
MRISVLQWNVWYREKNQNIVEFLKRQNADVLCLQELTIESSEGVGHLPRYLAGELGYNSYFKEIDLGPGKIDIANGIFSRFPISGGQSDWINEPVGRSGYGDEYRALVQAHINARGRELRVATTHMSYTHRFAPTPRKTQETDRLLADTASYNDRFILTGDLNATPGSYTINKLDSRFEKASSSYEVPTWTTKPFSYEGFEEAELRWRLDYIFATKDMKIVSSEVLNTDYSDHLPVVTVFELD